jgi:predicted dienelactone hydrolase
VPCCYKHMKSFLLVCLLAAWPLAAADSTVHTSIAGRDVAIWKPSGTVPAAGFPVVVFSHGFGGCNTQSVFLMEALANAGYLVVAPNHADAGCGGGRKAQSGQRRPEEPFQKASEWSDATYKDRRADIEAVLDSVLRAPSFHGVRVDANRVGIAGHSLGGYTALGVAGAWPAWKDSRIRAVLALSPYNTPFVAKGDLGHLKVPVMYQGGTLDFGISPTVRHSGGAYDRSLGPKYYVEFQGAGHLAWTGLNPRFHGVIDQYSVAFFDRYLKGGQGSDKLAALFNGTRPSDISLLRSDIK